MSDVDATVELPDHGDIEWAVKTAEPVSAGLWKPGQPPTSQDHWDAVCTLADAYLADRAARQALALSVRRKWMTMQGLSAEEIDAACTGPADLAHELEQLFAMIDVRQINAITDSQADARDAARYRDECADLRSLVHHLRHCVECGETDVMHCDEGKRLWDAAMKGDDE